MEYRGEGIEALVAVLEDMQGASLIMTDKKIKSLLKCLAYYEEFRVVLEYCSNGFDYAQEKRKAMQHVGEYNILRLPKTPKNLVALVVNMLVEFDEGKMDFLSFCGEFFPADTKQASFEHCFQNFFEPFKLALVGLVVEGVQEEVPMVERTVEFAANGLQEQTEYLLVAFVRAVNESRLPESERKDLLLMLEGFSAALDSRDTLMIKAVWLGVKKTLASAKMCANEIAKTDELLRLYLVVK